MPPEVSSEGLPRCAGRFTNGSSRSFDRGLSSYMETQASPRFRTCSTSTKQQVDATCSSGHGDWKCRSFVVPGRFRVVGLPHLSRYDITAHANVIAWIKRIERVQSRHRGDGST